MSTEFLVGRTSVRLPQASRRSRKGGLKPAPGLWPFIACGRLSSGAGNRACRRPFRPPSNLNKPLTSSHVFSPASHLAGIVKQGPKKVRFMTERPAESRPAARIGCPTKGQSREPALAGFPRRAMNFSIFAAQCRLGSNPKLSRLQTAGGVGFSPPVKEQTTNRLIARSLAPTSARSAPARLPSRHRRGPPLRIGRLPGPTEFRA